MLVISVYRIYNELDQPVSNLDVSHVLLYIALVLGLIGLFVNKVAGWITWVWFKLADAIGYVMSRVILSVIFFLLLVPISMLYRLFNKNPMQLRKKEDSYFHSRDHLYTAKDLENPW